MIGALVAATAPASASPQVELVYETGPAYVAQNDGRYGVDGTPYEADDVGQRDVLVRTERASAELILGRHRVIALYAPFVLATQVTLADELRFRDTTFAAGTVVDHTYRFDGFRASYLYQLVTGCLGVEVGGSLQIRSADVAFAAADGSRQADQSDIGLVPAAKLRLTYRPGATWAALEADGLSTFGLVGDTSGGIYDVALSVGRTVRPGLDVFADLRLLGGGAEVPAQAIDNWGNYLSAGLGVRWRLGR
ncbi:MAG: hypothetical protein R3B06_27375 [Kofleriaceae bacterium]